MFILSKTPLRLSPRVGLAFNFGYFSGIKSLIAGTFTFLFTVLVCMSLRTHHWAGLLLWRTKNFREVVITSPKPGDFADLRKEMQREFRPGILWAGGSTENLPLLDHRVMDSQAIFVCEDGACQLPVKNAVAAAKLFD